MSLLLGCVTQLQAATTCVKSTEECTACFDPTTFADQFPVDMENEFRLTLDTNPPSREDFCGVADDRMCDYHSDRLVRPKKTGIVSQVMVSTRLSFHVSQNVRDFVFIGLLLPSRNIGLYAVRFRVYLHDKICSIFSVRIILYTRSLRGAHRV
jgi:hypothetical protein